MKFAELVQEVAEISMQFLFNIIDGMFANFPGISGKSENVEVEWNGKC